MATGNEEEDYWNNDGGKRWVTHIDAIETMLSGLNDTLTSGVNIKSGEHILDIGCGGGVTSAAHAAAAGSGGSVIGADISEVILTVARERYANVSNLEFITADAGTFEFESKRFDVITSRFGVMFFPEPTAAFQNIRQAAKDGGRMVFICWAPATENPWMSAPAAAAFTILPRPEKPKPGTPGPFAFAEPDHVKTILGDAGFVDIKTSLIEQPLNMGSVALSLKTMTKVGPAAEPLREASNEQRDAAIARMREVFAAHDDGDGVIMQSAIWLVEARVP